MSNDHGLEGNLTLILDALEPKRDVIQGFAHEHRVDFFCGFSSGEREGGFTLTRVTLNRVAKFGVVGIELQRASFRWRVTVLALSIARRVPNSTMATFPEAPL